MRLGLHGGRYIPDLSQSQSWRLMRHSSEGWEGRSNFTRFTHWTSCTPSRSIFQSCTQNCFTLILHIYLPKLCYLVSRWRREQKDRLEGSGGCWQQPAWQTPAVWTAKEGQDGWVRSWPFGEEHTPSCYFNTTSGGSVISKKQNHWGLC